MALKLMQVQMEVETQILLSSYYSAWQVVRSLSLSLCLSVGAIICFLEKYQGHRLTEGRGWQKHRNRSVCQLVSSRA